MNAPSIKLQPGDFFCTENPMALGKLIRLGEALPWRDGHKAEYSHSGIITDDYGNTVEELWTLRANSLDFYIGDKVIIGRWKGMTLEAFSNGMTVACADLYEPYPFWRLAAMLIPRAARVISDGNLVCSERTMQMLFAAGWKGNDKIKTYKDVDPQGVADLIRSDGDFEIIFEGVQDGGNK